MHLMDEGKAADVVYLDYSKTFHTVSHSFLLDKLAASDLDRCTPHWVKKLAGWAGPKNYGEWSEVQLVVSHKWYLPGLNTGAGSV